ncbi:MAG: metallophosphoesterase [Chloroflexota bacterium]
MSKDTFNLWVFGDAHVGTDLRRGSRESLAEALRDSERGERPFSWDIAIDVGDMSGGHGVPEDDEGAEVVRQFGVLQDHPREAVYSVCGNHDRSGLDEPAAWWWRKWVDPLGENSAFSGVDNGKRPFPITGTWERYSFRVGNLLFLMMSDINEPSQTIGRGDLGGNPGGVVSGETFRWWQDTVLANPDANIFSTHHYMLKNTTVASGDWEGMRRDENGRWRTHYHGYYPEGTPQGASYLYWVDSQPDSGAFEQFLRDNPGAVSIWLGGHTHTHPDDTYGGKSHIEKRWGTAFVNAASLTRYHVKYSVPKSRLFTFREGSREVVVRCYIHTDEYLPKGWYAVAEQRLMLRHAFTMDVKREA